MLNRFRQHIEEQAIRAEGQTLLLAVSGGLDSTVMAHLFHRAGFSFALVHVHYGLRGEDSLADMLFVEALAGSLDVRFHRSDAAAFMQGGPKAEIQQAARNWRYRVFGELCREYGYRMLALAHHQNDQEEHFWMYRQRGNILSALSGMPERRPLNREQNDIIIIRPMLFTNREELRNFALAEGIRWREDRSNAEPAYLRNRLRLQQIPELNRTHPEAYTRFTALLEQHRPVFTALRQGLQRMDARFISSEEEQLILLNREAILHEPLGALWLKQYLAHFGFHADLAARIFASGFKNGLQFRGKTDWVLYSHTEGWYLVPAKAPNPPPLYLQPEDAALLWCGHHLRIRLLSAAEAKLLPRNSNIMHFDAKGLEWPLLLRSPQAGDRMRKLSGGHVKVGDLCTDLKIPVFKRTQLPLLYSGGVLLGIPGVVRSGSQVISEQSEQVLMVEYLG